MSGMLKSSNPLFFGGAARINKPGKEKSARYLRDEMRAEIQAIVRGLRNAFDGVEVEDADYGYELVVRVNGKVIRIRGEVEW